MEKDSHRSAKYAKRQLLERTLQRLNESLSKDEARLIEPFDQPQMPSIFIVGLQRSGTTLLMQLLLQHANFGYINNLIARFWQAPYQGTIFARSFRNTSNSSVDLQSDLGYTTGYEGPHEFSYFWRKWFPEATFEGHPIEDKTNLVKTIAALESEWEAPMLFKNIVTCSMVIPQLAELFPRAIFLYIKRAPFFIAQSTYLSRIKLFEDPMAWFGLKPPEFHQFEKMDSPWEQIAAQLFFCKKYIENSLSKVPDSRKVVIDYEELIKSPGKILGQIENCIQHEGFNLSLKSKKSAALKHTNQVLLDTEKETLLKEALKKYDL